MQSAPPSWGMPPPPPPPRKCWYSEVNSAGFWGCLFSFFILNGGQILRVSKLGLYFSTCTSQQDMCALDLDPFFSEVLDMDLGTIILSRKRSRKEVDVSDSAIFAHAYSCIHNISLK